MSSDTGKRRWVSKDSGSGGGGRRRSVGLRSVVDETTPEVVIEQLMQCPNFELPATPAGERRWLALLLDTADIGGLSEKDKRDIDKGEIVQQMRGGMLKVAVTEVMLDQDRLVFLPASITIETMREFSLLTKARYSWIVFKAGTGEETGALLEDAGIGPATFEQMERIGDGEPMASVVDGADPETWVRALRSLGGSEEQVATTAAAPVVAEVSDEPEEEDDANTLPGIRQEETPAPVEEPELGTGLDEPDEFETDEPFDYGDAADEDDFGSEYDDPDDEFDGYDGLGDFDEDEEQDAPFTEEIDEDAIVPDEPEPEGGEMEPEVVAEEADPEELVTVLGSEDLPLPVSLEALEAALPAIAAPSINYSLPDLAGADVSPWLREQVKLLAEASDLELNALVVRQHQELRAHFLEQMRTYAGRIDEALAVYGEGPYAQKLTKLDEQRSADLQQAQHDAEAFGESRRAHYEHEADVHAERVAAQARAAWLGNVETRLKLEVDDQARTFTEEAESRFALGKVDLMEERRQSAQRAMNRAELESLASAKELAQRQADQLAAAVVAHTTAIKEAVKTAYAADVERVDVLAKQQAINEEVATTKALAEQRVNDLKVDYESRLTAGRAAVDQAVADIEKVRRERDQTLQNVTDSMNQQLAARGQVMDDLRRQLVDETKKKQDLVKEVRDEYEARLNDKEAENNSLRLQNSHQRVIGWVFAALAVIVMVVVVMVVFLNKGF